MSKNIEKFIDKTVEEKLTYSTKMQTIIELCDKVTNLDKQISDLIEIVESLRK